jgi:predicted nucleic acid-binding protein
MRVLLDTNILIHREASTVVRRDIGKLFFWLDRQHCDKIIHPLSVREIGKHEDERVRNSFTAKLESYQLLKTIAPRSPALEQIAVDDRSENDRNDTLLVNELYAGRVDAVITEDRGIHRKGAALGVADRVFTIDAFLEKALAEHPDLVDYRVLAVRKTHFGTVDLQGEFFNSFRTDYGGAAFDQWFNRKADEVAYVCYEGADLVAFLYLKTEGPEENYHDIAPRFIPKRRLKIGTFKVELNGYKLGERFLKIIFDNAITQNVDEIYVTIFSRTVDQERLIMLLQDFGFTRHGTKTTAHGTETVYVRSMARVFDTHDCKRSFPFVSRSARAFIVPIYPAYHTSLLPDSILRTESPANFVEQEPHRNAIRKVYVSRSYFRNLRPGDTIVFYRTRQGNAPAYYESVVTSLGIVDGIYRHIKTEEEFISLCRKRSVFSDDQLRAQWRFSTDRPFVVGFLYAYAFPKRPTLKELIAHGIIRDTNSVPRGFTALAPEHLSEILALSQTDMRTIID